MDIMEILRQYEDYIAMGITWLPTVLFLFGVLFAILVGLARGFRKSVILFIHMVVAAGLCLAVFLFIVNRPDMDGMIVSLVNQILGKFGYSIQELLSVSSSNTTLHSMLLEMIKSNMSQDEIIYHIVNDNGAYIATIVEMAYRLVLFFGLSIVYTILLIIMKFIYWIFYPVSRKIKKHNKAFKEGKVSEPYHRRRLLGGLVGGIRGIMVSLVGLSFFGALIFVLSGGSTNPSREELGTDDTEISFGDETFNMAYDYYSYVCQIGDTGVFKVLNNIKDPNNTPYYFYICDLVLQGGIKDDNLDVDGTFYIRDEIGSYLGFTKDVMKLVLKYAEQEDLDVILENVVGVQNGTPISYPMEGSSEEDLEILNTILGIISKPGFTEEFGLLIENFEAKTYFVNLALASLTTVVNNIELVVTDSPEVVGIVKCLFGEDGIKVTDLATESDVKNLFKSVVNLIADIDLEPSEESDSTKVTIEYAKKIIPYVEELSIFKDRKDIGNKILGNLYTYCANTFVTDFTLPSVPNDMDWVAELNTLLDVVDPALTIYSNLYDPENPDALVENLFVMFDKDNEKAPENEVAYNILLDCLSESKILDVVFKSSFVTDVIDDMLVTMTGKEDVKIPLGNVSFGNVYDEDGNVTYGECYNLLTALKDFIECGGKELWDILQAEEMDVESLKGIVNVLAYKNDDDLTLADSILESKVLQYTLGVILINIELEGFELVVPDQAADFITENDTTYKVIKKTELKQLVNTLSQSIDTIMNLVDSETIDINSVIYDDNLMSSLDKSLILEGTVAKLLVDTLTSVDSVVLPLGYDNTEPWVNTRDEDGNVVTKGELSLLVDAIKSTKDIEGFDINEIMGGSFDVTILENIPSTTLYTMLNSKVLHYTFSNVIDTLDSGINIVIPKKSLVYGNHLDINNNSINLVNSSDLVDALDVLFNLVDFEEENIKIKYSVLFNEKELVLSSNIIQATVINLLNEMTSEEDSVIGIPYSYEVAAEQIKVLEENIWFGDTDLITDDELYLFLCGVEELLGGNISDDFDFESGLDDISIKRNSHEVIAPSAVLNSTIAKCITNANMYIPVSVDGYVVYEDERIVVDELAVLFSNLVDIFGTDGSLGMNELSNIDISSKEFSKVQIDNALSSKIFAYNISSMIIDLDTLVIPFNTTRNDILLVDNSDIVSIVNFDELDSLFACVFALFGDSININNIDTTSLTLDSSKVDTVLESSIISATISKEVLKLDSVYVPLLDDVLNAVSIYSKTLSSVNDNVITSAEMKKMFDGLFAIFGDSININDIDINSMMLCQSDLATILSSKILASTISHEFIVQDMLYVPTSTYGNELTDIYNKSSIALVNEVEMNHLFNAVFDMFGTKVDGDIQLDIHNIDVNNLNIKENQIDLIVESEIMKATISHNMVANDMLSVPESSYTLIDTYGRDIKLPFVHSEEMRVVFDILFDLFDEDGDGIDVNNDINDHIIIKNSNKDKILSSLIMTATISTHITNNITGIVVVDSVLSDEVIYGVGKEEMIDKAELSKLIDALLITQGGSVSTFDTKLEDLSVPTEPDKRTALISSIILRATITEQVFANEKDIKIETSSVGVAYTMDQVDGNDFIVLTVNEIVTIMNGIDIISGGTGKFDDISFDVAYLFGLDEASRAHLIDTIKGSSVYRYLINDALNKEAYGGYSIYELVGKYNGVIAGADMALSTIPLPVFTNFYHIIPVSDVSVIEYDSSIGEVVSSSISMFSSQTINALKECEYITL